MYHRLLRIVGRWVLATISVVAVMVVILFLNVCFSNFLVLIFFCCLQFGCCPSTSFRVFLVSGTISIVALYRVIACPNYTEYYSEDNSCRYISLFRFRLFSFFPLPLELSSAFFCWPGPLFFSGRAWCFPLLCCNL